MIFILFYYFSQLLDSIVQSNFKLVFLEFSFSFSLIQKYYSVISQLTILFETEAVS